MNISTQQFTSMCAIADLNNIAVRSFLFGVADAHIIAAIELDAAQKD